MKTIKLITATALTAFLAACGDHGFEGNYESSGKMNSGGMVLSIPKQKLTIGEDFMENNGQRQIFDEIFVRESGDIEYLVFSKDEQEVSLKIIDDSTLAIGAGSVEMTYSRMD